MPELTQGTVEIKAISREAGSRSKVAVFSSDEHVDPVGSLVGQRGVRVSTIMSELGGEKIDIIEWSENPAEFIEDALSPAAVINVEVLNEEEKQAKVLVSEDQQSLAIGKGGQNVRLAAKLTGWKIDIASVKPSGEETEEEAKEESTPAEEALTQEESIPEEPSDKDAAEDDIKEDLPNEAKETDLEEKME